MRPRTVTRATRRPLPSRVIEGRVIPRLSPRTLTGAILCTLGVARSADAAELSWQAPASCPTREAVQHRLSEALAMPLEGAADLRLACIIRQTQHAYRLELRVEPQPTQIAKARVFEAPSCERVVDAAVVAMALALGANPREEVPRDVDTTGTEAQVTPAHHDGAATDQPTKSAEVSNEPVSPERSRSATTLPWVVATRFGPSVDLGTLPGLTAGPEATIELGYAAVSVRLGGSVLASKRKTFSDGSGGEFSLWSGSLSTCGSTPRTSAHGSFCLGLELGQLKGEGIGPLRAARSGSAWWITPKIDVELTSGPFLLGLRTYFGATAGVPLERRPFTFGALEQVHRAAAVIWRLNAGLEMDWQ